MSYVTQVQEARKTLIKVVNWQASGACCSPQTENRPSLPLLLRLRLNPGDMLRAVWPPVLL
jgi:hypothetical protein